MASTISSLDNFRALTIKTDFIVNSYSVNLFDSSQLRTKRIVDILLSSLFLLLVASWLFPIIAILIKLESKGPVFYKQLRHGQSNVPFTCLKFRSMMYNPKGHFKQATKGDPRITRIGKIMRKTSIDELPQLINVLLGEMTLVGPRPHAIVMNKEFSGKIENFMYRHTVKPGITGLAQAKGFRGEIINAYDMNSRLRLDLFYIKKWSLSLDFAIIFWTLHSMVVKNDNAY
jgi:putative colanic acid biosysnthesis UDP-glucose lipid carrier transferase